MKGGISKHNIDQSKYWPIKDLILKYYDDNNHDKDRTAIQLKEEVGEFKKSWCKMDKRFT